MMNMRRWGLVALALSHVTCHQVILTAPPGSTMTLFANPEFIAAHGDVSVITAFVMEGNGTPVADGTVVQFFTNLGKIQEQAKTNDGVARVNLISDSRSGLATVSAFSGGGSGGGPTPTPTPSPSVGPPSLPGALSSTSPTVAIGPVPQGRLAAAMATDTVDVRIGSARPVRVVVTANPSRLTSSRTAQIVANVFDEDGNPIANVPVIFSVSAGARSSTETMDSGGTPIFTDTNGQASDVMRTRYSRDAVPVTATVTATVPNGVSESVVVTIN